MGFLQPAILGVFASICGMPLQERGDERKVVITLGDPVVVAQASPEVRGWGPYQFPHIERLADGRLRVDYHIEQDSATAYGKPPGQAFSKDEGKTWGRVAEDDLVGGLLLPNGDCIRPAPQRPIALSSLKLPKPLFTLRGTYGDLSYEAYSPEQVPSAPKGFRISRRKAGATKWTEEYPAVQLPETFYYASEGVLVIPNFDAGQNHWRLLPDGSILAVLYTWRRTPGPTQAKLGEFKIASVFLRSRDHGRSWQFLSEIPYQPDPPSDPHWAKREGFSEPDVSVLPDGSLFCLMRTTDGLGIGPMYSSRSADKGKSWTRPAVFDDLGVWPVLLTLKNGITLTAYGRPGFFLRATADPAGKDWDPRVEVIRPASSGKIHSETCSYSDLLAAGDDRAFLVYSDFHWPDKEGRRCKTILFRTVTVRRR